MRRGKRRPSLLPALDHLPCFPPLQIVLDIHLFLYPFFRSNDHCSLQARWKGCLLKRRNPSDLSIHSQWIPRSGRPSPPSSWSWNGSKTGNLVVDHVAGVPSEGPWIRRWRWCDTTSHPCRDSRADETSTRQKTTESDNSAHVPTMDVLLYRIPREVSHTCEKTGNGSTPSVPAWYDRWQGHALFPSANRLDRRFGHPLRLTCMTSSLSYHSLGWYLCLLFFILVFF